MIVIWLNSFMKSESCSTGECGKKLVTTAIAIELIWCVNNSVPCKNTSTTHVFKNNQKCSFNVSTNNNFGWISCGLMLMLMLKCQMLRGEWIQDLFSSSFLSSIKMICGLKPKKERESKVLRTLIHEMSII